jgi:hypothetical protein
MTLEDKNGEWLELSDESRGAKMPSTGRENTGKGIKRALPTGSRGSGQTQHIKCEPPNEP